MEWRIELATEEDDAAIRRLLKANPLPGSIVLTYEREPNYFLGCATMGRPCDVLIARHATSRRVGAVACRATRPVFLNGREEQIGYLGSLRVDKEFRGRWLVSRGFDFLAQLRGSETLAFAAITAENRVARGMFIEHPRRHFPVFEEAARVSTLALIVRPSKRKMQSRCMVRRGQQSDLKDIVAFLRKHGSAKQFFPAYSEEDFSGNATTAGFRIEDFVLAIRGGEIAGTIGLWDQSAYKQTIVQQYTGALSWGRRLFNAGARLARAQPLPPPGEAVRFAYASFICVADNDPDVFRALLRHVYDLAAERGYAYLMVGLAENDPLFPVASRYLHLRYRSTLHTVRWKNSRQCDGGAHDDELTGKLDDRIAHAEIATF